MDDQWARDMQLDCELAGVSFFFKQAASRRPGTRPQLDGQVYHDWPESASRVFEALGGWRPVGSC